MKSITDYINESKIDISDFIDELGITFDFSSDIEDIVEKDMLSLLEYHLGKKKIASLNSISIDITSNGRDVDPPITIYYDIKTDANKTYKGSVKYTFHGFNGRTELASTDIPRHKYDGEEYWIEDFCSALKNGYFK